MDTSTLKILLTEYNQKRMKAEENAQREKEKLYDDFPILSEIDQKLSNLALSTMKQIAIQNNKELLTNLHTQIEELKKEKQQILSSIGVRVNNILPNYECMQCCDTGYITTKEGLTQMCSCLKQRIYDIEYNKSNMNHLKKENFKNLNLNLYSDDINMEKYKSDISPRENIKLILKICQHFVKNFDNIEEKNLFFTGKTGLGKTFLSSCIANELLKKGKTVLYQTSSVLLDTIIGYRFNKPDVPKNIYDHLLNVDLLIIDDLGTEGTNNMKLVELFNILNSRLLTSYKPTKTIISTNLSLQDLFDIYDERIVSRIVGNYNICYFFGDDIRFLKK